MSPVLAGTDLRREQQIRRRRGLVESLEIHRGSAVRPDTESCTVTSSLYRPGATLNRTMSTAKASGPRICAIVRFCHSSSSSLRPVLSVTFTATL